MAKTNNTPNPKDDYDLGKALREIAKITNKTIEGRKGSAKGIGSDQSTDPSIGVFNLTINNNPASSDYQPQTDSVTELEVDAKIQNVELRYTKSQQEFQNEIRDKISGFKEELDKKMPKGLWIPFIGALLAVLIYFLNRYDRLQDKETNIIIEQNEINNRIDSIEKDIMEIKEIITSDIDVITPPADTIANTQ